MATVTTNLGVVTAYGDALAGGYTGTKAEFQTAMNNYAQGIANASEALAKSNANLTNTADTYSASATYAVGDYVLYGNQLYKCTTAITTAEAWTSGHWTAVNIGDGLVGISTDIDNLNDQLIEAQNTQPSDERNRLWIDTDSTNEVQVPTYSEFTDLNNQIDLVVCRNLAGNNSGTLYPVNIVPGGKITVSTSDGSIFASTSTLQIQLLDENLAQTDYWTLKNEETSRTITTNTSRATTKYIRWNETPSVPLMVNYGDSAMPYVEYFWPLRTQNTALSKSTNESPIDFFARDIFARLISGSDHSVTFTKGDGVITATGTASGGSAFRPFIRKTEALLPSWIVAGEVLHIKVTTSNSKLRFCVEFYDSNIEQIGNTQYITSDRDVTVPDNVASIQMFLNVESGNTVTDATISVRMYRSIYSLESLDESKLLKYDTNRMTGFVNPDGNIYISPDDWEIGGFNIGDNSITYGTNPKRIRMKQGTGYQVQKGDVIGLSDYTELKFYVVMKKASDGIFYDGGSRMQNYIVPYDGTAYIYIRKQADEVAIDNVYGYLSKFFIKRIHSIISDYDMTTASGKQFVFDHQYGTAISVSNPDSDNIIICGKNIYRNPHGLTDYTTENVTKIFSETDGTIIVSSEGASAATVYPNIYTTVNNVSYACLYKFILPAAMTVTFSANADQDLYLYGDVCMHISDGLKTIKVYNEPIIFKAEANKEYGVRIYTSENFSGTVTFKPQIEINTTYPTTFEPFKGVVVENGTAVYINTLSNSLDDGVLIDSYKGTVISYDSSYITVNYDKVTDNDHGFALYGLQNPKPEYRQPMISFIDDDTTNTTYVQAYHDVMDDLGVVGNYAAMTKKISESDALKTMLLGYEAEGFGVLLHCYFQQGTSTEYFRPAVGVRDIDQVRNNMVTGKRAIDSMGFFSGDNWVTPYGVNDNDIKAVAKSIGLKSVISTLNNTPNIHGVTDRYCIGRYSIAATSSSINENVPWIKRGMDACIQNGGWVIVTTHANEWGDNQSAVASALSEIVTYANSIGMKVVNFQEGFETYFN